MNIQYINFSKLIPWTKTEDDLNFQYLSLAKTTKHIHKIHPYKGKFIPQLAEHFLGKNFKKGDLILDPFCGSGTTLVQSNELGINSIGIDISKFNILLSTTKTQSYNIDKLNYDCTLILNKLKKYNQINHNIPIDKLLKQKLTTYNQQLNTKNLKPTLIKAKISHTFLNKRLLTTNSTQNNFLNKWYTPQVALQIQFLVSEIEKVRNSKNKKLLMIILSRTARSVLATPHSDLTTLKKPTKIPYYCQKHNKICKPIYSLEEKFTSYIRDTLNRLQAGQYYKTPATTKIIHNDSKEINLTNILKGRKLNGVFTSPPYVGQINYHKQHEYAYELFNLNRNDKQEIGPLFRGRRGGAQKRYVKEMSQVFKRIKPHLAKNAPVIIIANDRFNLYPQIAELSGYKIVSTQSRNVTSRNEPDQTPYLETIFTLICY